MRRLFVAAAAFVLAVGVAGTTWGVERERYVAANEAIFDELPLLPGARVRHSSSSGYRESESGPVVGYATVYLVALPEDARPEEVAAFYERELQPEWTLVQKLTEAPFAAGPILELRRGEAHVGINLESWRAHLLEIYVDHSAP